MQHLTKNKEIASEDDHACKTKYVSLFENESECCGCSACYAICSVHAIEMRLNDEGFLYPHIDHTKCVGCRKCIKICAFKNANSIYNEKNRNSTVYAARSLDSKVVRSSSSGGMFTELSNYILDSGGVVACSVYNYSKCEMEYRLITSTVERDLARGSKYIHSLPNDIFYECFLWLKQNPDKKLLFVGLGCIADGFRSYIQEKCMQDNVYIVDLICHGNSSLRIWKEYVNYLEKKADGKITKVDFKDKRHGWLNPLAVSEICGKEYPLREYSYLFYSQCTLRPSCYQCPYTKVNRRTDMTIGDYWGIERIMSDFYNPMGNSLVIVYTKKGEDIFNAIKGKLEWRSSNIDNCLQPRLIEPAKEPTNRRRFWDDFHEYGIEYIIKKYREQKSAVLIQKIKNVVKEILH